VGGYRGLVGALGVRVIFSGRGAWGDPLWNFPGFLPVPVGVLPGHLRFWGLQTCYGQADYSKRLPVQNYARETPRRSIAPREALRIFSD